MLNNESIAAVSASKFHKVFRKPLYDSYSFASIPGFVSKLLTKDGKHLFPKDILQGTSEEYDHVILFLIDGFGWEFFHRYNSEFAFLKRIVKNGIASMITAQYPSTTAVELTTIHSGLPIAQHGISEWNMYEPKLDDIISPLLFSFTRDKKARNTLLGKIAPDDIFPTETIYNKIAKKSINSFILQSAEFTPSPFIDCVGSGSTIFGFKTISEGLLYASRIQKLHKKTYTYLYFSGIDTMLHTYGPRSQEAYSEMLLFFTALETIFLPAVSNSKKTLIIMTADHGHSAINPATTIFINKMFPKVETWLKKNDNGTLLTPAGNCRNMFLHVKPEFLDEAKSYLSSKLQGKVEVFTKEELLQYDLFGPSPSELLLSRLGDLILLPHYGESIWWYEKGVFEQNYYGHHGGLTPEEMDIPLLLLPLR